MLKTNLLPITANHTLTVFNLIPVVQTNQPIENDALLAFAHQFGKLEQWDTAGAVPRKTRTIHGNLFWRMENIFSFTD